MAQKCRFPQGHATGSSAFVVGNLTQAAAAAYGGGASGGGGGGVGYGSETALSCYLCNVKVATTGSAAAADGGSGEQQPPPPQPQAAALLVVTPTDSFHRRVYLGALGLDLQLDAGLFDTLTLDFTHRTITAALITASTHLPGGDDEGERDENRGRSAGKRRRDGLRAGPLRFF
jgi:hypothetical protein